MKLFISLMTLACLLSSPLWWSTEVKWQKLRRCPNTFGPGFVQTASSNSIQSSQMIIHNSPAIHNFTSIQYLPQLTRMRKTESSHMTADDKHYEDSAVRMEVCSHSAISFLTHLILSYHLLRVFPMKLHKDNCETYPYTVLNMQYKKPGEHDMQNNIPDWLRIQMLEG